MTNRVCEVTGDDWAGVVTYDPAEGYYHVAARSRQITTSGYEHHPVYVTASRQEATSAADAISLLPDKLWAFAQLHLPLCYRPVEWKVWCQNEDANNSHRWGWFYFSVPVSYTAEEAAIYAQEHCHSLGLTDSFSLCIYTLTRVYWEP